MTKNYFASVDDTTCYELEKHISEAKFECLKEITLVEAVPDNSNPDYVWCTQLGEVVERQKCKKSLCSLYESKSGKGVCSNRGKLYSHGKEVTFKI